MLLRDQKNNKLTILISESRYNSLKRQNKLNNNAQYVLVDNEEVCKMVNDIFNKETIVDSNEKAKYFSQFLDGVFTGLGFLLTIIIFGMLGIFGF